MRIERVLREPSNKISVAELKNYINVVNTDRDEELQAILNASISKIEDITGITLTDQTVRVYCEDVLSQKLYYNPISEIVSVTNEETGSACSYKANHSLNKVTFDYETSAIIEYKCVANEEQVYELKPHVYEYGALLYDGDTENLEAVLRKVPRC